VPIELSSTTKVFTIGAGFRNGRGENNVEPTPAGPPPGGLAGGAADNAVPIRERKSVTAAGRNCE
jgi:hypothetical protein